MVVWGRPYRLFDVAGVVAAGGLIVAMLRSTARKAAALCRAEPLPRRCVQGVDADADTTVVMRGAGQAR